MKKKVLFIATVLRGHVLVFHLPYMQWFQQQGYEVHCCAGNDTGEEPAVVPYCDRYFEIAFERSPLHPANYRAYWKLKEIIDREGYELIHCHTPVGGMLGRLASRQARKGGTRVCYTAHGFHFYKGAPLKYWLLFYPAEKWLAHYTDLLITINQEDYARAYRFAAKEVALVHGVGVDLTRFDAAVEQSAVRASIGVDADTTMLITVGEHIERKNHAVCIRALRETENTVLVFCGIGRQEEQLRALAKELQMEDRVLFLGFRKDVAALLRSADIFVFPSLHEGLPVSLMEAMAAGLPCVVSRVRGNIDLIDHDDGGYVAEPFDVAGFSLGIRALQSDSNLRCRFGDRNRSVVQQYCLPCVRIRMAELYREQLKLRGNT